MTDPQPHLTETQNRTIQSLLANARQQLVAAGCDSPRLDAELLLAHILGRDRTWLYRYPQVEVTEAERAAFLKLIDRRVQREPVAYLIGHKAFYGLDFVVTSDTLIPRPETELLVETAIAWAAASIRTQAEGSAPSQKPKYSLVDVGTGSGCIAVTLAKMTPEAQLTAIDLSDRALAVARLNAERHDVADRIEFLAGDLLAPLREPVDLIASNPPYIDPAELTLPFTAPEVNRYEPRLALDGGEAGLAVVRRLLAQAAHFLKPGGMLLVEIGATQGNVVKKWAQAEFPTALVEIKPDLAGWDRLLVVKNRVD
ncbi:MAG: peptide chain release factor N(5)-glutamine methyltransferase [Anaerolineaceae bacterium]|nr:peptide chain release factor N(5)-glutamine methyltransferase [Anaerolineaceae bacterium]